MKEKIGKLLELLNEYAEQLKFIRKRKIEDNKVVVGNAGPAMSELILISKSYGFIKWLVENDKIDLDKVENKFYNEICITDYGDKDRVYGKSDLVISVLSISSSPIDDLISYLR